MSTENIVFRKIKEISARGFAPRPSIRTTELVKELSISHDTLVTSLRELKHLKLVNISDGQCSAISLTLLGTMVTRDK